MKCAFYLPEQCELSHIESTFVRLSHSERAERFNENPRQTNVRKMSIAFAIANFAAYHKQNLKDYVDDLAMAKMREFVSQ